MLYRDDAGQRWRSFVSRESARYSRPLAEENVGRFFASEINLRRHCPGALSTVKYRLHSPGPIFEVLVVLCWEDRTMICKIEFQRLQALD